MAIAKCLIFLAFILSFQVFSALCSPADQKIEEFGKGHYAIQTRNYRLSCGVFDFDAYPGSIYPSKYTPTKEILYDIIDETCNTMVGIYEGTEECIEYNRYLEETGEATKYRACQRSVGDRARKDKNVLQLYGKLDFSFVPYSSYRYRYAPGTMIQLGVYAERSRTKQNITKKRCVNTFRWMVQKCTAKDPNFTGKEKRSTYRAYSHREFNKGETKSWGVLWFFNIKPFKNGKIDYDVSDPQLVQKRESRNDASAGMSDDYLRIVERDTERISIEVEGHISTRDKEAEFGGGL